MRNVRRSFALWLVLILLLLQPLGALAAPAPALEDSTTVTYTWRGFPSMDEEANQNLSTLLNALTVFGREKTNPDGSPAYSSSVIRLDGEDILSIDVVWEEDCAYVRSPLFGTPLRLDYNEMEQFLENLMGGMQAQAEDGQTLTPFESFVSGFQYGLSQGTAAAQEASSSASGLTPFQAFVEKAQGSESETAQPSAELIAFAEEDFAALEGIVTQWAETALSPVHYADGLTSYLGFEADDYDQYELTRDELVSLIKDVAKYLLEDEPLLRKMVESYLQATGEPYTAEMLEEAYSDTKAYINLYPLVGMFLPEDFSLNLYQCFDEMGEESMGLFEMGFTNEDSYVGLYAEWMCSPTFIFYGEADVDDQVISLSLWGENTPQDPAGQKFHTEAGLELATYSYGEQDVLFDMILSADSSLDANRHSSKGSLEMSMELYGEREGFAVDFDALLTNLSGNRSGHVDLDFQFIPALAQPFMSVDVDYAPIPEQGPPFDPATDIPASISLFSMNKDEFMDWFANEYMPSFESAFMELVTLFESKLIESAPVTPVAP